MLVKRFEEQVERHPHKIALRAASGFITYKELNCRANRIARLIQKRTPAAGKSHQVGLLFDHGPDMIAAILGTLKAGKIYVPLSPTYPLQRIAYMLTDSQSFLLLAPRHYHDLSRELAHSTGIDIAIPEAETAPQPESNLQRQINANRLAYIMYTSGSTGKPKGVMQTHDNVIYYTRNWIRVFSITASDRMTLFSSFCHDGSIQDLFSALLSGAILYPYDMKQREESIELSGFLTRERITLWHSVPSLYSYFANTLSGAETFKDLRFIILGGEPVREHEITLLQEFFPHSILACVYGQTESSVDAIRLVTQEDSYQQMLIGQPLEETQIFVIDQQGNPVEPLETGEILIVSPYVSPGYWNNSEASAAAFGEEEGFGKLYWSGDLGCLLPDGGIEFLGRKDFQVKIRGFRIEPGEIESRLLTHPQIKEAVVTLHQDNSGDSCLCAYIVTSLEESTNFMELKGYLAQFLPDYMIPAHIIPLDSLPLTPGGKVNRLALPSPRSAQNRGTGWGYEPPRNRLEAGLVGIWSEVLGIGKEVIGIHDDFFQLGGHSLKAITMTAKIAKKFAVKIPLAEAFKRPRLKDLAQYLQGARVKEKCQSAYSAIIPLEKKEYYPLSPAQQRFYMLQQLAPASTAYNIPQLLALPGHIDTHKLEQTFKRLIQRHEALRTSFITIANQPVQRIHETVAFEIEDDEPDTSTTASSTPKDAPPNTHRPSPPKHPFDLSKAPLLRVKRIKTGDNHCLLVDLHHIISDGTSQIILTRDFRALYAGEALPPIPLQYRDFSAWQHRQLHSGQWQEHENYWLKRLNHRLPLLQLPTDYPRPKSRGSEGARYSVTLGTPLTEKIKGLGQKTQTTLYMILLSAYTLLLARYTGQQDIIVGTPVSGRDHADLEHIIGLVIGGVMMRNFPTPRKSFLHFLEEVKTNTLEAFEHQAYPYEELLRKVDWPEEPGHNPITDVSLIVQNLPGIDIPTGKIPGHATNQNPPGNAKPDTGNLLRQNLYNTSKMDLTLTAVEQGKDIGLTAEYCTALFKPGTIQRFVGHLLNLLAVVTEEPELAGADIDITGKEEKIALIGSPAKCYPLSHAQKRIYYMEKIYPDNPMNNVCFSVRYREILDKELLEKAINYTLRGNDALRLRIVEMDFQDEPLQYISPYQPYRLESVELPDSQLQQWLETESKKPFRLFNHDLCYFAFLKFNEQESGFYMKMHHLVSDGWTRLLLARQITDLYRDLLAGKPQEPTPNPSYIDYLLQERQYLNSPQAATDRAFWHRTLIPLPEKIDLAGLAGNSADKKQYPEAGARVFALDHSLRTRIHHYCKTHNTSIFKILFLALSLYISRVTGNEDIVIGSFNHNRAKGNREKMAGMFVSTFPLRIKIDQHMTFAYLLEKTGTEINQLVKNHSKYPFDWLSAELKEITAQDPGYLMDINLIGHPDFQENGFSLTYHFPGYEPNPLSLHINVNNKDLLGTLELEWHFQLREFSPAAVQRMHGHLVNILQEALTNPEKKLRQIRLLTAKEKEILLYQFNNTKVSPNYEPGKGVCQRLRAQVGKTPGRIALIGPCLQIQITTDKPGRTLQPAQNPFDAVQLSYRELDEKSHRLAYRLVEKGVKPDTLVGLLVKSSLQMIIGIWGILKAGGAYLPIDPHYPDERVDYILKDSGAKFLLTSSEITSLSAESPPNLPPTARRARKSFDQTFSKVWPPAGPPEAALAYIIHTSGSTGRPKGVMVNQGNLMGYIAAFAAEFPLHEDDTAMQQASYTFDVFVEESYPILLNGGRLAIANKEIILDPELLLNFIVRHRVSMISCSPRLLNQLNQLAPAELEKLKSLRIAISGGDRLEPGYIRQLQDITRVYNTYGPTETTVCATYYLCLPNTPLPDNLPIGKPIAHYSVYIWDRYDNPLPIGSAGELCIAGTGVSRGYMNQPELTAEKFCLRRPGNLFEKRFPGPSQNFLLGEIAGGIDGRAVFYRSGDLARWLPDGNIEFLGRIDRQVKIRGYRIELGEIENRLTTHDQVKEAAVIARNDAAGDKYLCAYIVPNGPVEDLARYLSQRLPEYMIPTYFIFLEQIPLTPQGKIDINALPEPGNLSKENYVAPQDHIEETLVQICAEVLGLETPISMTDNFFKRGGHSLRATTLVSKIKRKWQINMPLVEVFNHPELHQLADYIKTQKDAANPSEDTSLILLKETVNPAGQIFFIHDGSGDVEAYLDLCHLLDTHHGYNYWGIKAGEFDGYAPKNLEINDLAQSYLKMIKEIQPSGPYRLAGWSLGGIIAFEIVSHLEQTKESVDFFAMIDTRPPKDDSSKTLDIFTLESELHWIKNYLPDGLHQDLRNAPDTRQMWTMVVDNLETFGIDKKKVSEFIAGYERQLLPNYNSLNSGETLRYLNIVRSFERAYRAYSPSRKINTPLYYFNASQSKWINPKNWQEYCRQPVQFYEVSGDHYSILKFPQVIEFAKKFAKILNRNKKN